MAALSTIALAGLTAASGVMQYQQQRKAARSVQAEGRYAQEQAERNARLQERYATEALAEGDFAARRTQTRGQLVEGAQRASLAAQGLDTTTGSASELTDETRLLSSVDARSIREQAALEAWGFTMGAMDLREQGVMARRAADNQAGAIRTSSFGTLLTTGASLFGQSREWDMSWARGSRQRVSTVGSLGSGRMPWLGSTTPVSREGW